MNILKRIEKWMNKPSAWEVDIDNRIEFQDAIRTAYNEKYTFGYPMDNDKTKLFVPTNLGGSYSYMYYDTKYKMSYVVSFTESEFNIIYNRWLKEGKLPIQLNNKEDE